MQSRNIASLGGVPLERLDLIEATAALDMLRSRFVQEARKKQETQAEGGREKWFRRR